MTGRTHDLAAFTALTYLFTTHPIDKISLATAFVAMSANFIGGLAPDIDQSTATLWNRFRGGSIVSRFITPLLGGHRFISHSIIGLFLFGFVTDQILRFSQSFLIVDRSIVWWAFMIGFISHLIFDTFSRDGVPWLFPIPIRFGIPPLRALRIRTGGIVEKSFIFPALLLINIYLFYSHYAEILRFLKQLR